MYRNSIFAKNKKIFSFPLLLLIIFRFLSVSFISFFLLSPYVKKVFKKTEKPTIIIATDNSNSILLNKDSVYVKNNLSKIISEVSNKLEKKYHVVNYTFGNNVSKNSKIDFSEQRTNFSELFDVVYEQSYNKNLGAVILVSDGIFNDGNDPVLHSSEITSPVYTIALGDTTPAKDIVIRDIAHNSIAFAGNKIPVQIDIAAFKLKNFSAVLKIENDNLLIHSEPLQIESNTFFLTKNIYFEAKKTGLQKFTISLSPAKDEISIKNNIKDIFIEILDEKKKVIIIANAPHPDVSAIKMALRDKDNYQVKSFIISDVEANPALIEKEISTGIVFILHQVPSDNKSAVKLINLIENNQLPALFILGSQSSVNSFNKLNTGLQIAQARKNVEISQAFQNQDFNFFTIENNINQIIAEYPPLLNPFGNYKMTAENQILFYQKIGNVKTDYPLFVLMQNNNKRSAIIAGEGIWRWKMSEFKKNNNSLVFDEIIQKTLQFLSLKEDRRYFRISSNKFEFYEDEQVYVITELFNKNFEKRSNADIKLKIIDAENKQTEFRFYEIPEGYKASVGYLKPGKYLFTAETNIDGKTETLSGIFIVKNTDIEFKNTTANHNLLFRLAENHNGEMYFLNETDKLMDAILSNNNIKPQINFNDETHDLIEIKLLFFIIILLLATEWFIRKFFGSY